MVCGKGPSPDSRPWNIKKGRGAMEGSSQRPQPRQRALVHKGGAMAHWSVCGTLEGVWQGPQPRQQAWGIKEGVWHAGRCVARASVASPGA